MSQPTTSILLNSATPAAPSGNQNVKPQSDGGTPLQSITMYVPNTGGVAAKTASYTAVAGDCGKLLSFNSSSAVTLTLPATAPFAQWTIAVQNVGAGALTVSRNGLNIDGAAANLTLAQGSGVAIQTDGTNYFTERGIAPASATPSGAAGGDLSGTYPNPSVVATHLSAPLPVAQGGTGTGSPGIVAGTNVTVSGTWPNQTISASGGGGGGGGNPQIRGYGSQAASAATYTVSWPAGTVAGDLAIIFFGGGYQLASTPSGWTANDTQTGTNWNGSTISKVLNSTDISAGNVVLAGGGTFDSYVAIVTFVGATGGIREVPSIRTGVGSALNVVLGTSGSVISTDTLILFGSARNSFLPFFNRGRLLNLPINTANAFGAIGSEYLTAGGAQYAAVSYAQINVSSGGQYFAIAVVKA